MASEEKAEGALTIEKALQAMLQRARKNGASRYLMKRLQMQVNKFKDIFRVELGRDPPARVPPMVIELIDETTVDAHRVPARTFAPLQQQFLQEHMEILLRTGVIQASASNATSPI